MPKCLALQQGSTSTICVKENGMHSKSFISKGQLLPTKSLGLQQGPASPRDKSIVVRDQSLVAESMECMLYNPYIYK